MSLARGSANTLALRLLTLALQVPTSILLARLLGVEGKGEYTLLTVVPWLTTFVMITGLDTSQCWLLSSRKARLSSAVKFSLTVTLIVTPLAAALYYWGVAPRVLDTVPRALVLASCLLVPFVLARYFTLAIILGFERVVGFNLIYLLTSAATLTLLVVFTGLLGWGLAGALAAFVTAQAIVVVAGIFMAVRYARLDERPQAEDVLQGRAMVRRSLAYAAKGYPAGLLVTFNQRFDIFILGALAGPYEVGLYAVAVAMAEVLLLVPVSVHLNFFPRVAAVGAEEGARRLPRACRMTLMLTACLAVLIGLPGRYFISLLFGGSFLPAYAALVALLPGVLSSSVAFVVESYFAGVDRRQYQSVSAGVAFAVGLLLCLWLIPRYGALGAALASTVGYTIQMAISLNLYRRLGPLSLKEFFVPRARDLRDVADLARSMVSSLRGEGERG